jgi:hypothetical protein
VLVNLQRHFVTPTGPVQENMIFVHIFAAQCHFNAHAEHISIVEGAGIWIFDFVGCDSSTSTIEALSVATCLGIYDFDCPVARALVSDRSIIVKARRELRAGEKDGANVRAMVVELRDLSADSNDLLVEDLDRRHGLRTVGLLVWLPSPCLGVVQERIRRIAQARAYAGSATLEKWRGCGTVAGS